MGYSEEQEDRIAQAAQHQREMLSYLARGRGDEITRAYNQLRGQLSSFLRNELDREIVKLLDLVKDAAFKNEKTKPQVFGPRSIFSSTKIYFDTSKRFEAVRTLFSTREQPNWRAGFIGRVRYPVTASIILGVLGGFLLGPFEAVAIGLIGLIGNGVVLGTTLRGPLIGSPFAELNEIGEVLQAAGFRGFITMERGSDKRLQFKVCATYDPEMKFSEPIGTLEKSDS